MVFRQHLSRKSRTEILIVLFDQGYGIVALGIVDLVVPGFTTRLVADRSSPSVRYRFNSRNIWRFVMSNMFAPF